MAELGLPLLPPFGAWALSYGLTLFGAVFYKSAPMVSIFLATLSLATPFCTNNIGIRSYLCFSSIWFWIRSCELATNPQKASKLSLWERFFHVIFYADILNAQKVSFEFNYFLHIRSYISLGVVYGFYSLWTLIEPEETFLNYFERGFCGWMILVGTFYFLDSSIRANLLLFGLSVPPLFDPRWYAAQSNAEFWRAQNRVVQPVLRKYIFNPIYEKTKNKSFSMATTFLLSGLYHAYPVFVSLGNTEGFLMIAYFTAQLLVVIFERNLRGIGIGSTWVGSAWVWLVFCLTNPIILKSIHVF